MYIGIANEIYSLKLHILKIIRRNLNIHKKFWKILTVNITFSILLFFQILVLASKFFQCNLMNIVLVHYSNTHDLHFMIYLIFLCYKTTTYLITNESRDNVILTVLTI